MDRTEIKANTCAFWCGILEGDTPIPASWREVRTVRGVYTTLRQPAKQRAFAADVSPSPLRRGDRLR
jgi:hypothetical protein